MTDVALLSPLAGLARAANAVVPALRDRRRGEEDAVAIRRGLVGALSAGEPGPEDPRGEDAPR